MSRDTRRRKGNYSGRHSSNYQFGSGSRQGDDLGADSPNWRDRPEPSQQKSQVLSSHQSCSDFLQKGWEEVLSRKATGDVKEYRPDTVPPKTSPLDIDEWIQNRLTAES